MATPGPEQEEPYLSIIIPAFREASAIRNGKLRRVREWLEAKAFAGEILVVDDGSDDDTVPLAREEADRVLQIAHHGKAAALLHGFAHARGRFLLWTDMDLASPIAEGDHLLRAMEGGADLAIGSRGWKRDGAPLPRLVMSWTHSILHKILGLAPYVDTQCGFKAATRVAAEKIEKRLVLYRPDPDSPAEKLPNVSSGFDLEMLIIARALGLSVAEVPVQWTYVDTRRVLHSRDAFRGLEEMLRLFWLKLQGAYRP